MALTKITNDLLDLGSDTGALGLPKGTTAQRPSNPVEGTLRHNSEIDETKLETYNDTEWRKINAGGSVYSVDYLVIAGGGGGGLSSPPQNGSGGGGAGGLLTDSYTLNKGEEYSFTVGAGGSINTNGGNTIAFSLTAIGGGKGGPWQGSGTSGGSGGGSGRDGGNGGNGVLGQGFNGGTTPVGPWRGASGGGGYISLGGNGGGTGAQSTEFGGNGGNGFSSSITGNSTIYACGGGGCTYSTSAGTRGGDGGSNNARGGRGDYSGAPTRSALPGDNNSGTGGGGGGAASASQPGGSGVVILRMPTSRYSGTTTGSPTVTTDGTDTILTYTSSGTYTA
jgi:hypothetical protein